MRNKQYDLIIIGGGAAGMAAAIAAKQDNKQLQVLIIEKKEALGRKINATGNGRCNITNVKADNYLKTLDFFSQLGLAVREYDNGLVYPYSESAKDVNGILTDFLERMSVDISLKTAVTEVQCRSGSFLVTTDKQEYRAAYVLIASGGKAGPEFGCTGDGYKFALSLGHSVTKIVPVLTSVECQNAGNWGLSGIRAKGRVSLFKNASRLYEEDGEIQFTNYGLSGICIFNMTREMKFDKSKGESLGLFEITLNLYPEGRIYEYLRERVDSSRENGSSEKIETVLRSVLKNNLAKYVITETKIELNRKIAHLSENDIVKISENVHALKFIPTGLKGWKNAQCTSGGIKLDEIDEDTGESKIVKNLYFAGEVTDYDGPCGGYNLNHAWLTGIAAGKDIQRKGK